MISQNIQSVKEKMAKAALGVGRNPDDITLVAVSKRFPAETITEAFSSGQMYFGENYIQEVQAKRESIPELAKIHFIGHLQTNKAKVAAETCNMIETVDRLKLARALNKHLDSAEKRLDILVQVNIGKDPKKSGITENSTEDLLIELSQLPNIRVCGFMTMPPFEKEAELSRPYFRNLRLLADKMQQKGHFQETEEVELSMGMSNDYHIAIEEGATIVRVGTAIFGQRDMTPPSAQQKS